MAQPEAQAWLDLGFAYMTINYHGSTGFGKAWESSIYGIDIEKLCMCN